MLNVLNAIKRLIRRPFERSKDMKLQCVECGKEFRFEWGEQQFYKEKQLINIPCMLPISAWFLGGKRLYDHPHTKC